MNVRERQRERERAERKDRKGRELGKRKTTKLALTVVN